jgi:hypothetical protein
MPKAIATVSLSGTLEEKLAAAAQVRSAQRAEALLAPAIPRRYAGAVLYDRDSGGEFFHFYTAMLGAVPPHRDGRRHVAA